MTADDSFVGEIGIVGFNFATRGWALCNGQILSISQNTALFALLGTYYGGDGRSTFGLPNLQGRIAINQGQGPGLSDYIMGQTDGNQTVTLSSATMPAHTHSGATPSLAQPATNQAGTSNSPETMIPAATTASRPKYAPTATNNAFMASYTPTLQSTGSGQPFSIMQATLALNYCIALIGIFPARN